MNRLDTALSKTPQSDDAWHCPWFRLIEFFSLNGTVFGLWAGLAHEAEVGWVAAGLGFATGVFSLGSRTRGDASC